MKWFHPVLLLALSVVSQVSVAQNAAHFTPPKTGTMKVAFVLSDGVTVIDVAGPWDVFESVHLGDDRKVEATKPFELFTVAPTKTPIHTSGSNRAGMTITPDYDFSDVPMPDIVVVAAQRGGPGLSEWLQKVHAQNKLIMSVCTGAGILARAGLLDGRQATTHHWFFDRIANGYPTISVVKDVRFVEADPIVFTSGGEASGVDLALHLVSDMFGQKEAQNTADYMEYQGGGWKTNKGVSASAIPTYHELWQGEIAPGRTITWHITSKGANLSTTADSSWQHLSAIPAILEDDGNKGVTVAFKLPSGNMATFVGTDNATDDHITGTYKQDGKSYPLTMVKKQVGAS